VATLRFQFDSYQFSDHAIQEMARRQIADRDAIAVLANPGQVEVVRVGRIVMQSRIFMGDPPALYLLRVFVDIDVQPPVVVTVYRTSKIAKYWKVIE